MRRLFVAPDGADVRVDVRAGVEQPANGVKATELGGKHLVLADIGSDIGIALGNLIQGFDDALRLDVLAVAVIGQAILRLPAMDALPPFLQGFLIRPIFTFVEHLAHFAEDLFGLADDRYINVDILGDRGRIYVDMDDLGMWTKLAGVTGNPIVETRTDGKQHVAFMHAHVGLVGAMHAKHADILFVGAGKRTQSHQGLGDRVAQLVHDLAQFAGCLPQDHPATAVYHRPLGRYRAPSRQDDRQAP